MTRVEKSVEGLMSNITTWHSEQDGHTRLLVLAIAKKIVPDLAARHGLQEIESLLNGAIRDMAREPRLVVRVNDSQLDIVNESIKSITVQHAYAGQVIVIADADTAAGDCRIEWADGGIERSTQATWNAVEQTIGVEKTPDPTAS
jgi:flagellar assembly protein FliH